MEAVTRAAALGPEQGAGAGRGDSLAYVEPEWTLVLILAAFLLALNVLHGLFDALLYAGLLGQLVLGALIGTPLAAALPEYIERAIQSFGYLGLLLLIARGGVETRLDILSTPSNLLLATLVGLTGIGAPIGLSFAVLGPAFSYTTLESFALGASLSATSLGTAFAVIDAVSSARPGQDQVKEGPPSEQRQDSVPSQGQSDAAPLGTTSPPSRQDPDSTHRLSSTRIASLLVGAALLDDIIGLVLAAVISNLGQSEGASPSAWALARPVVASLALILVTALVARLSGAALTHLLLKRFLGGPSCTRVGGASLYSRLSAFVEERAEAVGVIAFVGLLSAFVAISHAIGSTMLLGAFCAGAFSKYLFGAFLSARPCRNDQHGRDSGTRLIAFIQRLGPDQALHNISGVVDLVLVPFFFASIGFAIPLRSLFKGSVLWRGWVYACLMAFAKVLPGGWILAADALQEARRKRDSASPGSDLPLSEVPQHGASNSPGLVEASSSSSVTPTLRRPWQPALLLGLCLVSRGEVGFIIINLARQSSILSSDEAFNVGVWAIVLNTLFGPLGVGFLLRANKGAVASRIMQGPWGVLESL